MISDEKLKEFEEYRKLAMDGHVIKDILDEALPAIYAYKSKVEEMQKELEFYGNEDNWKLPSFGQGHSAVVTDRGERARIALKGNQ